MFNDPYIWALFRSKTRKTRSRSLGRLSKLLTLRKRGVKFRYGATAGSKGFSIDEVLVLGVSLRLKDSSFKRITARWIGFFGCRDWGDGALVASLFGDSVHIDST